MSVAGLPLTRKLLASVIRKAQFVRMVGRKRRAGVSGDRQGSQGGGSVFQPTSDSDSVILPTGGPMKHVNGY